MNLVDAIAQEELCHNLIVETSSEYRYEIKDGILYLVDNSYVSLEKDTVILPTKSELARFGVIVQAYLNQYHPELDIEIHRPGVARRLDEYNLKYDFVHYETKYLCNEMKKWMENHPEYQNTFVDENLIIY